MAILFLPGTFIHEVSHFLAAIALFVPAGKLELIPEIKGEQVKLGSVRIEKTDLVRRFLIGVAPFVFGTILIITTIYLILERQLFSAWWAIILTGYVVFEVGNTMFASRKDLEGSLRLFLILLVLYGVVTLLGASFPVIRLDPTILNKIILAFEKASFYLAVPIGIDLATIFLLDFLFSKKG